MLYISFSITIILQQTLIRSKLEDITYIFTGQTGKQTKFIKIFSTLSECVKKERNKFSKQILFDSTFFS